jgi:hypothetical protein
VFKLVAQSVPQCPTRCQDSNTALDTMLALQQTTAMHGSTAARIAQTDGYVQRAEPR